MSIHIMEKFMMWISGFMLGTSIGMFFTVYILGKGDISVPITFLLAGITMSILGFSRR